MSKKSKPKSQNPKLKSPKKSDSDQMKLSFEGVAKSPERRAAVVRPNRQRLKEPAIPSETQAASQSQAESVSAEVASGKRAPRATAESMAREQREISVSEFFAKNRHLLGFDNKRKALLTAVKEAVDNSLDACEEAHILPDLRIVIRQLDEDRFKITVRDNGPGIIKQQIPNIFGKLLYGSKFHRLRMSRGQQGIGISAAGMYGLLTTGRPIQITSRLPRKDEAHYYEIQIDTKKNKPEIVKDETVTVDWDHGTEVTIELVASYLKGRQSVDEYVFQTALANPHASIAYKSPVDPEVQFPRSVNQLPHIPAAIKPHPHGVELGTMIKMLDDTKSKHIGGFLQHEFSRVSPKVAAAVCKEGGVTNRTYVNALEGIAIEKIYKSLQKTKLMAPPTHCLAPIGAEQLLAGLTHGVKAEFFTATTRPPSVYRGNPFLIEVGLAYGGELGPDRHELEAESANGNGKSQESVQARLIRFANRVPLLYQQSACCMYKSVLDISWNNYGISQSRGALPSAPLLVLIHMASVWVPFTSESKEAIADYDEIRKETRLAIQECGRRLSLLLKRKKRTQAYSQRRDVFTRYIDEVVSATRSITRINKDEFRSDLLKLAKKFTRAADLTYDEHGQVIDADENGESKLEHTIVVDRNSSSAPEPAALFDVSNDRRPSRRAARRSA